mmetsp:Transcript_60561/g.91363  ORF Transcript_60561/g.91363 Transcript_60561/m.91363 type:complete len:184 (-) Transcript_60561:314-865(-)|eukprot:CAMPEP_0117026314 /NCGR_PEP_ID=MMETSP0472-20121206/19362_1 /TAXON_ID=693140 ORGANISM="Tiarina fusus, Strain LIS" /NCGR_SAMPLE_ID=MMETSP0472 /ASSEMBLY_ACC=CAM_ASM_000603 /LENGTH=183 /DNA_ID=CAMNT_0004733295 /DNA_START=75 /DNA_END=626 /DNA_ORIENTATION=+
MVVTMSTAAPPSDMQMKLTMIGDSGVGKTCLLLRYAHNPAASISFGIDFKTKTVEVDGALIHLQISDTTGKERLRTVNKSYFRDAQGILLVYDVTDQNSFESIRNFWISQIQQHADSSHVNTMLVGNKCDMSDKRIVSTEDGQKLAAEFGILFCECSAQTNINVGQAFEELATAVKDSISGQQ